MKRIVREAREKLGEVPVVMGETGIPMDMKSVYGLEANVVILLTAAGRRPASKGTAFSSDDWTWQETMMDSLVSAYDSAMIGYK